MQQLLVEDKSIVHLGPMIYQPRFFQSELEDLEIEYIMPLIEPTEYLKITENVELFPLIELIQPEVDQLFHQLAGPFQSFDNNEARGTYLKIERPINDVKNDLKQKAATKRYEKEVGGFMMEVRDTTIFVETDRNIRNLFIQKQQTMENDSTVNWKFSNGQLSLNNIELKFIIISGEKYIQEQFDWENKVTTSIDNATTIEELIIIYNTEELDNKIGLRRWQ